MYVRALAIMQLSSNRVYFTYSSVSQYNYGKFLSHPRGTSVEGINDIVTVLGLHRKDTCYSKSTVVVGKKWRSKASRLRVLKSIVPYKPLKRLKFNCDTTQWFRGQLLFVVKNEYHRVLFEFDLRFGSVTMCFYRKSDVGVLFGFSWVIHDSRLNWGEYFPFRLLLYSLVGTYLQLTVVYD